MNLHRGPPSNRVRQARRSARLSQLKLASLLGVHRSAVSQWESSAGTRPTVEHLAQIAVATGVNFEWIATGRGRMRFSSDLLGEETPVVVVEYAAQDEMEARVLVGLRKLDGAHVEAVLDLVESLGRSQSLKLKRRVAYSR